MFTQKAILLDASAIERSITRISHEIVEKNEDISSIYLIGIRRRGVPLARRIAEKIKASYGVDVPVAELDVSPFRDDTGEPFSTAAPDFVIPVEGKTVVLVDDVLYTGRTVRAAIEAVLRSGRAGAIRLAALIDRGHRELPIRADYVGKNIPTSRKEKIAVRLNELDGITEVAILTPKTPEN
ncbi:MAG: bifunctional pyr operon transcriptional regulator/uracil phosphoribosyltransferase PyrR [Clostridia bacterium]|nr:bifunctional pyr operon transcriptional regulator/uracil phosphoribosyltransferase PyrR [Clostridia bacterium]